MRTLINLYRASLHEWSRDSTSLLWSMAFPVVIALAVGVMFSGSGQMFLRIGLVNEAGPAGEAVLDAFTGNAALRVTTGERSAELDALDDGKRDGVVIIPAEAAAVLSDYAASSPPGDPIPFEMVYDPMSPDAQAVISLVRQTITAAETRLTGQPPLFSLETITTSSDRLSSADRMLPGVLAMSLMLMGLYVTAIPLVSLREKEVLRRMSVTPLSRLMLLVSQVAFRLTVALIQSMVVIIISVYGFDLPLKASSLPEVAGVLVLGAVTFIMLGYFLAALSNSEEAVQFAAGLVLLLFTLFSGILLPLWRIPGWVRPLVDAIPLTYLADALRQTMVNANPEFSMSTNLLVLVGWLVVCAVLALRFFHWEPRA